MIKDTVHSFMKEHNALDVPASFIAQECGCTTSYVILLAKRNHWQITKRKYGKAYISG
jgi:hypothetical protein